VYLAWTSIFISIALASSAAHAPVQHKQGFWATLWHQFNQKLERMQSLDEDNEKLRESVAKLELENAHLARKSDEVAEQTRSEELKAKSHAEGGHDAARTVASLKAADESFSSKPPKEVFNEAADAFANGDFETSAKAMVFLADNEDNVAFRTASTFYMAGVSLYKLNNFKRALSYLKRAEEEAKGHDVAYAPRAMAWMALCHERLGAHAERERTIKELLGKYPKTREAQTLNRSQKRTPAAASTSTQAHGAHHKHD